jgi:hypothetical protein
VLTQCSDVYPPKHNEAYAVANPQNLQTIIRDAKPLDSDSTLSAYLHTTSHLDEHILNADATPQQFMKVCTMMHSQHKFANDSRPPTTPPCPLPPPSPSPRTQPCSYTKDTSMSLTIAMPASPSFTQPMTTSSLATQAFTK